MSETTRPSESSLDPTDPSSTSSISISEEETVRAQLAAAKLSKAPRTNKPAANAKSKQKGANIPNPEEKELTPNQYYEIRSRQIKKMKENPDTPDPYPHVFNQTYDIRKFVEEYGYLKSGEVAKDVNMHVTVRIRVMRAVSNNLVFLVVQSNDVVFQVMCQLQEFTTEDGVPTFREQTAELKRGDVVGIIGYPGRTAPRRQLEKGIQGELSIFATQVVMLAPCAHILPDELKDLEKRFRDRAMDFILNPAAKDAIKIRAKVLRYIRDYLTDREFEEMETPMLHALAGGATAKPFVTYHNDHKMSMFMRIAPELHLKMLIIGGFDRVFEIGRQFRNESADLTHNPEFTTCEFYMAHADVYKVMDMTEELVSGLVKAITGGTTTKYHTSDGEEYEVNWAAPWKRVQMIPALEEATGEKFPPSDQLDTPETAEFLKGVLKKMKVECSAPLTNARMIDSLVGEFLEEKCINPTFIMDHPEVMSPLAKHHRKYPGLTERFEAFVCKKELVNAYTEMNDPFKQRARFQEQARQKAQGDDEAQPVDEDFLRALEYGLPPTAGWGMGIDRLVMFLTDNYNIKEVLAFPFMKNDV